MMRSHANIVALADRLRIDSNTRGELESMRKEVFAAISEGLKRMSSKSKNPWRLTRHEQFRTGSLYRGTAMKGASDIDVVLLLNYRQKADTSGPPNAKEILLLIQSLVPDGYVATLNARSVKVTKEKESQYQRYGLFVASFNQPKELSMDIVPALRKVGKGVGESTWWYGISKVRGSAQWVLFNPIHQKEIFGKLSRRTGQRDDPTSLIICLKHWRNQFRNAPCKVPSFVFEVLVWEDYRNFPEEKDLTTRFNRVLSNFERVHTTGISFAKIMGGAHKPPKKKPASGIPLLHDPSNTAYNLVSHLNTRDLQWWSNQAKQAANPRASFHMILREW